MKKAAEILAEFERAYIAGESVFSLRNKINGNLQDLRTKAVEEFTALVTEKTTLEAIAGKETADAYQAHTDDKKAEIQKRIAEHIGADDKLWKPAFIKQIFVSDRENFIKLIDFVLERGATSGRVIAAAEPAMIFTPAGKILNLLDWGTIDDYFKVYDLTQMLLRIANERNLYERAHKPGADHAALNAARAELPTPQALLTLEYSDATRAINKKYIPQTIKERGTNWGLAVYADLLEFAQDYSFKEGLAHVINELDDAKKQAEELGQELDGAEKEYNRLKAIVDEKAKELDVAKKKSEKLERGSRKKQVRKPRALNSSELYTATAVRGLDIFDRVQDQKQAKEMAEYINSQEFFRLSNSYGFLTDAILSYLKEYQGGERKRVTIGKFVPEGNTNTAFSEEIAIQDTFSNFCAMAGIIDTKQRMELYKEIKENRFATRGIALVNKKKNDYRFTQASFLLYEFTSKKLGQLKNLHNVRGTDAIDTIKLRVNKDIFSAALIDKKGSGTRGFTLYPERLERQLRDTVKAHSKELMAFCQGNKAIEKYLKGGDYTSTIRPLFNMLINETGGNTRNIGGKDYLEVNKPIGTYARSVCEQAYHIDKKTGREVFKKGKAIAHISYAIEVLKYFYLDGTENVNIHDYCFTDTHIVIHIDRPQKGKLGAPKGK